MRMLEVTDLPSGWFVVPVEGKRPTAGQDWPAKAVPTGRANGGCAWGLLLGPRSGVIDIECDSPDAERRLAEIIGENMPVCPTWLSRRGKHRLFAWSEELRNAKAHVHLGDGLEARIGNDRAQSVLPPADGREWLVTPDQCDPPPLPPRLLDAILKAAKPQPQTNDPSNGEVIPQGYRNSTLTSLAGVMRRRGMTAEAIENALLAENANRCDPPLSEDEVKRIARSVSRYLPASVSAVAQHADRTDLGNSERLVSLHGDDLRYVAPWKKWVMWDGQRWRDDMQQVERRPKDVARRRLQEAGSREDIRWARYTASVAGMRNMLTVAQSELAIDHNDLDRDPFLLNVKNGTLDLRTGKLRPHKRRDFLTKLVPVTYDPNATAPLFDQFLNDIMDGDSAMIAYLRRLVGYALTGVIEEHVLPIFYGTGANGKSTFVNTILALLGTDYSCKAPQEFLMEQSHQSHPTALTDLFRRRLVVAAETKSNRRLDESLMKELTGGDPIRARRMREDYWEFEPTHKVWLVTNHKPIIRGEDEGLRRRLRLIPFTVRIPDGRQDPKLGQKLRTQLSGILNWALAGCREWQQQGLGSPKLVDTATDEYFAQMDLVGEFLNECTKKDPKAITAIQELHSAFEQWGGSMNMRTLANRIASRGYTRVRITSGVHKGRKGIVGLRLAWRDE